ncbi:MAG: phosphatidylserine/phosphatidylglycerophosphate/cardiolipin synthase family protein [Bacteroidales bacterium]|jgi:cardiolipin synthase|nr:phosphatidylserine/phosphatidylglycerophosphate/cardiolipin synthase family protein [Bacteroidales bacterium]
MTNEDIKDNCIINHKVFSETLMFYTELLRDIENAQKNICIEIFKFIDDSIGVKFRDALVKKSRQGVRIRLLIDSWGAIFSNNFFDELIKNGGQVRIFKKLRYNLDAFIQHHRRNHRKIVIIDDVIAYIGSANINDYSINWREIIVKIEGNLAHAFKKAFNDSWKIYEKNIFNLKNQLRPLGCFNYKIIRDIPSITKQKIKKKFENLIKNAKKEIIIETPYFLPGFFLRKLLMDAGKRGVDVKILTPKHSDVSFVDIYRSKYLGILHKNKVNILFYTPNNLHAKLIVVDKEIFCFGSTNFDYRSFRYMFEIILMGSNNNLMQDLLIHINETLDNCEPFNYDLWKRRPLIHKIFEQLLVPFRHYL